jgi:hypothetical protein
MSDDPLSATATSIIPRPEFLTKAVEVKAVVKWTLSGKVAVAVADVGGTFDGASFGGDMSVAGVPKCSGGTVETTGLKRVSMLCVDAADCLRIS